MLQTCHLSSHTYSDASKNYLSNFKQKSSSRARNMLFADEEVSRRTCKYLQSVVLKYYMRYMLLFVNLCWLVQIPLNSSYMLISLSIDLIDLMTTMYSLVQQILIHLTTNVFALRKNLKNAYICERRRKLLYFWNS